MERMYVENEHGSVGAGIDGIVSGIGKEGKRRRKTDGRGSRESVIEWEGGRE
jgi:hypothetical protein